MKILKKNQLIILVISLMLVTAGYLNFTSTNNNGAMETSKVAELGDATLVNSEKVEESSKQNIAEEKEKTNIDENKETKENETTQTVQEDTYFENSKLERENIYSQMLETYQEIYNNVNSTQEQKNEAIKEIANINEKRNSLMIAENLIKAKGIENIVIFANTNSVSVIVKAEKLEPEQIAQIQNIVARETKVKVENIHISDTLLGFQQKKVVENILWPYLPYNIKQLN